MDGMDRVDCIDLRARPFRLAQSPSRRFSLPRRSPADGGRRRAVSDALPPSTVEVGHFAARFSFDGLFFEVFALVCVGFAFSDAELQFHSTIFPVESERDQGLTLDRACLEQAKNLGPMKQEFSHPLRIVLRVACSFVGLNVEVVKVGLVSFNPGKRVIEVGKPTPDRFDLSPG